MIPEWVNLSIIILGLGLSTCAGPEVDSLTMPQPTQVIAMEETFR